MSAGLGSSHTPLTTQQKADAQTALGLGTAATQSSTAFATAAQGAKADTALQNVAGMTTAFNAGTSTEKAAFRSAVQGDGNLTFARTDPLRIATFGDSTATFGTYGGPSNGWDQERVTVTAGSAVNVYAGSSNKLLVQTQYPGALVVAQGGISGQTTTQMLARTGLAASATRNAVSDVLGKSPDAIIFRGGSINDIFGLALTGYATDAQIAAICANHVNLYRQLRSGGAYVIDEGCAGYDAYAGTVPANQAYIRDAVRRLNIAIEAWHASARTDGWLSPVGLTCDETGAFLVGATGSGDGTHLGYCGQYRVAVAEAALITRRFGLAPGCCYRGRNLLDTLAHLTIGSAAPSWVTWYGSGCTVSVQMVGVDPVSGQSCIMANVSNVVAGAYVVFGLPNYVYSGAPTSVYSVASGTVLGYENDWSIERTDGGNIGASIETRSNVNFQNTSSGRTAVDFGGTTVVGNQGDLGVSRLDLHSAHTVYFDDVTANLNSSTSWKNTVYLPAGGAYTIRVRNPRIVLLT